VIKSTGHSYVGQFLKGSKHGQGEYVCPKGRYVGGWKNGKRDGEGKLYFPDGKVASDVWADDVRIKKQDQK
jgi:radial spoke head protein 1